MEQSSFRLTSTVQHGTDCLEILRTPFDGQYLKDSQANENLVMSWLNLDELPSAKWLSKVFHERPQAKNALKIGPRKYSALSVHRRWTSTSGTASQVLCVENDIRIRSRFGRPSKPQVAVRQDTKLVLRYRSASAWNGSAVDEARSPGPSGIVTVEFNKTLHRTNSLCLESA